MFYQYSYQKATIADPHPGRLMPTYLKLFPTIIAAIGMGLIGSVIYPLLSYQFVTLSQINNSSFDSSGLISPLVDDSTVLAETENQGPQVISNIDYSRASNWFTFSSGSASTVSPAGKTKPAKNTTRPDVEFFSLAIPSLGIPSASVKIGGEDLSKSLIQFPGTAFPGEYGTPVIFGHSTLPQFFKPDNYTSIFSTLPTIQVGADIFVTIDKVTYTYRVAKLYQVKPSDTWALNQNYDQKTLKLITCVPPGTKLKRLVVEANLVPTQ